jgi:hypothetical protein
MSNDSWADKLIRADKDAKEREQRYERAAKEAEAQRTEQPEDTPR